MKNIQVIDGALNAVYDIFRATDQEFSLIFPPGQDIGFVDEVMARGDRAELDRAFAKIWKRRIPKALAMGIHGVLCNTIAARLLRPSTQRSSANGWRVTETYPQVMARDRSGPTENEPRDGPPGHARPPDPRWRALLGLLIALLLVVGGVLLVRKLGRVGRLQDCVMSGRTDCAPIDPNSAG